VSLRSSLAILGVLAVFGLLVFGLLSKGSSGLEIGDAAPVEALPRLEGDGSESLADYRGRWVLVNFWASWCPPCRAEAADLQQFQEEFGGPRFTVLGIDSRDLTDDGVDFVERYAMTYPQLRDGNGDTAHAFGTTGLPESFLIDPKGKVRLHAAGEVDEVYLGEEVVPLLPGGQS
jgi:cytochrome c biogenesis protein CcmG, thiol:disulfide interchange protein DsbE